MNSGDSTILRFECDEDGKSFEDPITGTFSKYHLVTCEADGSWNISSIPPCECRTKSLKTFQFLYFLHYFLDSHCIDPPTPDSAHKLKLSWNSTYPPAHGENVTYVCDAGSSWNRFENNFGKNSLALDCLRNNTFEDVEWPTCSNSKHLKHQ